jgi:hypothetical protein
MRKSGLLIDDGCRRFSPSQRHRQGYCWGNDYMGGGTKSATGVRDVCRCMKVRDLKGRTENQQERAAKNKGQPPGLPYVLFGLLIVHHYNYNVAVRPEAGTSPACGQKSFQRVLGQRLGNCFFPPSLGFQDKLHDLPR